MKVDARFGAGVQGIAKITLPTPFPVGPVNVYLLQGDAVTLVDCGAKTEEAWESLNRQLKELGYAVQDIDQVVLTHHHADHCGLLDWLRERKDLPVYAHPLAAPWVSRDREYFSWHRDFFQHFYREMGVDEETLQTIANRNEKLLRFFPQISLQDTLKEGDRLPGNEEWTVYETPGHAQSHLVFYRERDGVMIAGDHIIKHISSNAIVEPPASRGQERPKTLLQYRESLRKCRGIRCAVVFTGHGEEVFHPHELLERRLKEQEERAKTIRAWLAEPLSAFEICRRMFPKASRTEPALALSEVVGHLDLLLATGQVTREQSGEVALFRAIAREM
ncbi:MBL fold metallo-hydrolase [Bacillaceae bacterium]